MRLELENWSEAETDLNMAREILCMLSQSLHNDGLTHESDVVFAAIRMIGSGLSWIECGLVRSANDCSQSSDDCSDFEDGEEDPCIFCSGVGDGE